MPKVSVILTSYNHEKYIAESIQSVLDQTFTDFELLIFDDGSRDRSQEIIRSFHDKRIRLFLFPQNRGASVCFREVEHEASGEYIAMHHSDDVWEPEKLARQVAFLDSHPVEYGAVFSQAQIINEDGTDFQQPDHFYSRVFMQDNRTRQEWLRRFFYEGNCLCHPSMLIRHECYEKLGMYDDRFSQVPDLDFWIRLCQHWEIYILQEKLVRFRIHSDESNASGSRLENTIRTNNEYLLLLQSFLGIISEEDFFLIFPEALALRSTKGFILEYALARVCLNRNLRKMYHCFGLFLLYRVMGQADMARKIQEIYGFGMKELSFLAQQYDVFNVMEVDLFRPTLYYAGDGDTRELLPIESVVLKNGAVHIQTKLAVRDRTGRDVIVHPVMGWPCTFSCLSAQQAGCNIPIKAMEETLFQQQIMSAELCPRLRIDGNLLQAGLLEISYKVSFLAWGEVMQVYIRRIEERIHEHNQQEQKYNALLLASAERENHLLKEKQQAEQERQRAEQEKQQAEQKTQQSIDRQEYLASVLMEIQSSRGYRLLKRFYRVRDFFRVR